MTHRSGTHFIAWVVLLLTCTIQPLTVLAQATSTITPLLSLDDGFQPQHILDDRDLFDIGNMNPERIQAFLDSRGTLGRMRFLDIDGQEKSATDIIWRVAVSYKMNPKYLLALLQKEQSLVEDRNPSQNQLDWATGYGVCDSCSKNDPSLEDFKGFASQLEWAAKQHRDKYLQQILLGGRTIAGYAPGKETVIDGTRLIPDNQATAMLYSYTPHIAGNLSLWRIWRRWFGLTFPDGTIVQGRSSKQTYLIRFGEKRPFRSRAVAASMIDPSKIVLVDDSQLTSYPDGKPIAFANYSLVETEGKRYLIDGQKKRLIVSNTIFDRLGFNEDELIETRPEELAGYENGSDITLRSAYPTGLLAKDPKGTLWYIEEETRRLIPHGALVSLYFKSQPPRILTQKQLNTFPVGDPYRLHDGELVQIAKRADVYVIENGHRRPIPSGKIFEELGWNWKNIVSLPESLLAQYPVGDPVDPYKNSLVLAQADPLTSP